MKHPLAAATLFSAILFAALLAVRMNWFQAGEKPAGASRAVIAPSEVWMGIFQDTLKIGVSHRKLAQVAEGISVSETTVMRINTMGVIQEIRLETDGIVQPDYSLISFRSETASGGFRFKVSGKVEGNSLLVEANGNKTAVAIQGPVTLSAVLWEAAAVPGLSENETRTLSLFDPLTLSPQPVKITALGMEPVDGKGAPVRRVSAETLGSTQYAWIDAGGSVLREQGIMGITLRRISRSEAEETSLASGGDWTQMVSVPLARHITDPENRRRLVLRITGAAPMDTERQHFENGMLTIEKESMAGLPDRFFDGPAQFLEPSAFIQSDHPEIIARVKQIIRETDPPLVRVQKISRWVALHIEKKPVLSVPNALETLRNKRGDCNEHAVLFAALARAARIPARIETGLVYLRGRFYYHAWNSVYLGRWITADALMNQIPADVTHIAIGSGNPENQAEILAVIGRIGISPEGPP